MKGHFLDHFNIIFLCIAAADLICVMGFPEGRFITKPLIMIALMGYYFLSADTVDLLFFVGLFFAFLGDVFLLFEDYFLFGLGSFLIMQFMYAICFFRQMGSLTTVKVVGAGLIALMTVLIILQLLPSLEASMTLPVVTYSLAIGLMGISAILRKNTNGAYMLILIGVLSFLISDGILGWSKFAESLSFAGVLIMSTYMMAQYLIVKGYLKHTSGNNAHASSVII